jgi:hypothetical protein
MGYMIQRAGGGVVWVLTGCINRTPIADHNAKSFKHITQFQIDSYKVFFDTQYLEVIRINNGGSSEICLKEGRNLQVSSTMDFRMIKTN